MKAVGGGQCAIGWVWLPGRLRVTAHFGWRCLVWNRLAGGFRSQFLAINSFFSELGNPYRQTADLAIQCEASKNGRSTDLRAA